MIRLLSVLFTSESGTKYESLGNRWSQLTVYDEDWSSTTMTYRNSDLDRRHQDTTPRRKEKKTVNPEVKKLEVPEDKIYY